MNKQELTKKLNEVFKVVLNEAYQRTEKPTEELPAVKRPANMSTEELIKLAGEKQQKVRGLQGQLDSEKKNLKKLVEILKNKPDFEDVAKSMGLMEGLFNKGKRK